MSKKQIFDIIWENDKKVTGVIKMSTLDKDAQAVEVKWSDGETTTEYISEEEITKLLNGEDLT